MAKIKNRILIILALVMLCAVGLFALSACSGSETYTVTFMVRENGTTGDWQQYTTVDTNDDGSVTLPAEPTVDGYTFRDWYTDEACSADNVFDESNVTGDITCMRSWRRRISRSTLRTAAARQRRLRVRSPRFLKRRRSRKPRSRREPHVRRLVHGRCIHAEVFRRHGRHRALRQIYGADHL